MGSLVARRALALVLYAFPAACLPRAAGPTADAATSDSSADSAAEPVPFGTMAASCTYFAPLGTYGCNFAARFVTVPGTLERIGVTEERESPECNAVRWSGETVETAGISVSAGVVEVTGFASADLELLPWCTWDGCSYGWSEFDVPMTLLPEGTWFNVRSAGADWPAFELAVVIPSELVVTQPDLAKAASLDDLGVSATAPFEVRWQAGDGDTVHLVLTMGAGSGSVTTVYCSGPDDGAILVPVELMETIEGAGPGVSLLISRHNQSSTDDLALRVNAGTYLDID